MFDAIHCEQALPDGRRDTAFQSKSLHSLSNSCRITSDGRLLERSGRDTRFHGVFRFPTWEADTARPFAYEAEFTDGHLQHLRPADSALYDDRGFAVPSAASPS